MKAILCGYYGQGNGGDEALLVSLLQMLPPEVTPIVLSGDPIATQKQYGVASCRHKSAMPILKAMKMSEAFIWGGGSLMQDATSIASPIYYAGLMALAQQQGLKTIAWAQGIGPLNKSLTRWLTKNTLLGCTAISVRDRASAALLEEWGIEPLIAPDPVWALESTKIADNLVNTERPVVAVNLRSHPLLTPQRLELLTQALQQFQTATDTYILLVPFQQSKDLAIAKSIEQVLENDKQIISLSDPRELKGLFQQVRMTIGMRLHSLIMSAAENCNCFALSYDPKVSQLMQECNLAGWELTGLPNSAETIAQRWIDNYSNPAPQKVFPIKELQRQALLHGDLLRECLLI